MRNGVGVHAVQLVVQRQYLQRAERVQQVRVVPLAASKSAALVLAAQHPGHDGAAVHEVEAAEQVQRGEAPVHAAHAKMLGGKELEAGGVLRAGERRRKEGLVQCARADGRKAGGCCCCCYCCQARGRSSIADRVRVLRKRGWPGSVHLAEGVDVGGVLGGQQVSPLGVHHHRRGGGEVGGQNEEQVRGCADHGAASQRSPLHPVACGQRGAAAAHPKHHPRAPNIPDVSPRRSTPRRQCMQPRRAQCEWRSATSPVQPLPPVCHVLLAHDGNARAVSAPRSPHNSAATLPARSPSACGRRYTVSIAVAASCIENAQNLELATLLAGQVARAAAIFNVDEVVVLDDAPGREPGHLSSAAALFARVLQFMETPQYLKK